METTIAGTERYGTIVGPSGVVHAFDSGRTCWTCGRDHTGTHGRTVRAYVPDTYCRITYAVGAYPYPCVRQDEEPDAYVATCHTHGVWWVLDDDGSATAPGRRHRDIGGCEVTATH